MTIRDKMTELLGFNDLDDHNAAYEGIVNAIGFEKIHALLPADDDEIVRKYKDDPNLNNIPIKKWEMAAGYRCWYRKDDYFVEPFNCALKDMLYGIGVTAMSCAGNVCVLKACARMVAENK